MGEFDDVLAMEPGDEWDDYDAGDDPRLRTDRGPVVAALHVPGAVVELRGDVPDELVAAVAALTAPTAVATPEPAVIGLRFEAVDGGHDLVDDERGPVGTAAHPAELTVLLVDHVLKVADQVDARALHLHAAAVVVGDGPGRGILILQPDALARHRLVAALVERGARYLGADRVVLVPGSRTVLAVPTPLRGGSSPVSPAQVAPATTIEGVVVVEEADRNSDPERLGRPHACARLLVDGLPVVHDGHELLRAAASLMAGAVVWSVPAGDPDQVASVIAGLETSPARELAVTRAVDGMPGTAIVRFGQGGVLVDVERSLAFELAEEELPTLDSLRWPVVAREPEVDAAVLEQLAVAGIDLRPASAAGMTRAPGPESYGLPDSPTGSACSALWDTASVERAVDGDAGLVPVLAHGVRRGDLVVDESLGARLASGADIAAERRRRVDESLAEVLELLEVEGIEPLVLGSVVTAHDGPLPSDMVVVDRIELLLAHDELARGADTLVAAGATVVVGPVEGPPTSSVEMALAGGGVPVWLHDCVAAGPFGELVDHDELLDRSVRCRIDGRWVPTLHPDDRFVWACVQMEGADRPTASQRRDVVLSAPGSAEGMAAALEASARWGATRTVLSAIRSVDVSLPGLSPWLVERATRRSSGPDRRRRRASRRI